MKTPYLPIVVLAVSSLRAPASAKEPSTLPDSTENDRTSVAVTVYNVNLAFVRESRSLGIDHAGAARLRFMDVPSAINPRTVHLRSVEPNDSLAVLEQNYEYDLLSPSKLMEKYVGRRVEIVEQADDLSTRTREATLLSVNGGPVFRVDDRILLGHTGKVTLPDVPEDLVPRPTLVWTIGAEKAGRRDVEASYLTDGMNWSADYVAVVDGEDRELALTSWVTVDNRCGATFRDATLKLVAGDVRRVSGRAPQVMRAKVEEMAMAAPSFEEQAFFEYHLYTLDRPTTLKDRQTKQLSLFQTSGIPLTKKLVLRGQPAWYRGKMGTLTQPQKIDVTLEFENAEDAGLGIPLPRGTIRVYKEDLAGDEQFIGEDTIDHTPRDETVTLLLGQSFDVVADRTQTDYRSVSKRESEAEFEIEIRNRKDEDVTVIVREPVGGEWQVLSSSHPAKKLDAGTLGFEIPVPARREVTLRYRVAVRW